MQKLLFVSIAAVPLFLAANTAHAQGACPPSDYKAAGPEAPSRAKPPRNRQERRLAAADRLVEEQRYEDAAKAYAEIAMSGGLRADFRDRVNLRLARTLIRLGRYDEALALAQQVERQGAQDKSRRQAGRYEALALDSQKESIAEQAYAKADALADAGYLEAAENAFSALTAQPCPVRPDFFARVNLRLAAFAIDRGDLVEARARLAMVGDLRSERLQARSGAIETRLAQATLDASVLEAAKAADLKAGAGDVDGALALRQALLSEHSAVSPNVKARLLLASASDLLRADRFDEAAATVRQATDLPISPGSKTRADAVLASIDRRRREVEAQKALQQADALRDRGQFDAALRAYDAVATAESTPDAQKQRALLRKASLLRTDEQFGAARETATQVSRAPVNDEIAGAAAKVQADIERDAPLNSLHGYAQVAVLHDRDALAETAAINDEDADGLPFAPGAAFSDASIVGDLSLEYRRRLNFDYDYLRVSGRVTASEQDELDEVDRLAGSIRAGPVIHVGERGLAGAGLLMGAASRGGDWLNTNLGGYAEYGRRFGDWRAIGSYSAYHRDDTRREFDGWRHRMELGLEPTGVDGGPNFNLQLGRDAARADVKANWSYGAGAGYSWKWGGDRRRLAFGAEIFGSYRHLRYEGFEEVARNAFVKRRDDRWRYGAAFDVTLRQATTLRLEYAGLEIASNESFRERSNDRFSVSIRRRF